MNIILKTLVAFLFIAASLKTEAQSVFGESWYQGGFGTIPYSIALSPRGDVLAMVTSEDPFHTIQIHFYDTQTGRLLKILKDEPGISYSQIVWAPKGEFLITTGLGADNAFTFIDTATCQHFQSIPGPGGVIQYSPDSTYILAGKFIYSTTDYSLIDTLTHEGDNFTILPGDSLVICGYSERTTNSAPMNNIIHVLRFPSGDTLATFLAPTKLGKFGYAGKYSTNEFILIGRDSLFLMDVLSGAILDKFPWEGELPANQWDKIFFSRDDQYLFAGFSVYNFKNKEIKLRLKEGGRVYNFQHLSVSHDNSKIFFSKSYQTGTYICKTNSLPASTKYAKAVDFSGKLLWRTPGGHEKSVFDISFENSGSEFTSISVDTFQITWSSTGEVLGQKQIGKLPEYDTSGISPSGRFTIRDRDRITDVNGDGHPMQYGRLRLNVINTLDGDTVLMISDSYNHPNATRYYFQAWAWMPNDRYLLTASRPHGASADQQSDKRFLKIWDIELGKVIDSMPVPCYPTLIKVSPDGKSIALATEEFGIMHIKTIGDFATSILTKDASEFSLNFHPNPLKESSTISCSLPADGAVKITLHDMLGREVAVLHDAFKSVGNYTFPFKNENLQNGLYFLKMTAGGQSLTKTVRIVR